MQMIADPKGFSTDVSTFDKLLAKTKEIRKKSKEINQQLFIFHGTWTQFLIALEKAGIVFDRGPYEHRLEGLDCVECADWHYVLIGTAKTITNFIKEREELFAIPVTTLPTVSDDRFSRGIASSTGSGCW